MKHLKEYKLWEQSRELTPEQEGFLNRYVKGTWRINSEGLVDVEGDFDCAREGLNNFQGIRFGTVSGDFNCSENSLSSLEGAPREVRWNFYCSENNLISLEGAPLKVGGNFYCRGNPISKKTINFIRQVMKENPNIQYGIMLNLIQNKISKRDWDKLDKSSMEGITDRAKGGYKLLAGIGGI